MKPNNIIEVSWEICNKIGGIYTVVSTKAKSVVDEYKDNYILIGPDVWKETTANPDFIEDENLLSDWKAKAWDEGLKVRTGRWNIEGKPIVVLVDFTPLFTKKDEIFSKFWETYKLDSIQGQWDYVEPAMFGYAAGEVIKSLSLYYFKATDYSIAHFHEWMTGTGILYLKEYAPQVGTVFTTHATVLGRSLAGNGFSLYKNLEDYNPENIAREFNVVSKNSLETISAREADVFTTVSGITAKECKQFLNRKPDVITTNGFEEDFVPKGEDFKNKRKIARSKALEVASFLTGKSFSDSTQLLITSGRYEFRNKGIDLFIKALGKLNHDAELNKDIVAYITIPTAHRGPTNAFRGKEKMSNNTTHKLQDWDHDAIVNELKNNGLNNTADEKVSVIFVPAYLNEHDGVIDLAYYDFLIGFDLSVFPSYYEPWGYTPLESIAFKVPTITSNVAGFGDWVKTCFPEHGKGVVIIDRNESDDNIAIEAIYQEIKDFVQGKGNKEAIKETTVICKKALWKEFAQFYFESWNLALDKLIERKPSVPVMRIAETAKVEAVIKPDRPEWKKVLVQTILPENLKPMKELAYNLWWSWNAEASELFESIDPDNWEEIEHNPVLLIELLSVDELNKLSENKEFINKLNSVYKEFKDYLAEAKNKPSERVAYFSMEYGLHPSIKTYSGGLGILAGDYLKQASDSNKNMIAVGLLYRNGYFKQSLSIFGDQIAEYKPQKFTQLPLMPVRNGNGEWVTVKIALPGRPVEAKVWKLNVGRIPLYLLDTDIEPNGPKDKTITSQLYGGDNEHRLKQEMLLGLGGVRLINKLKLDPMIFHLNEGHSAFSVLERVKTLMDNEGFDFKMASEIVRASSLFTTHTPVPAGHDTFEENLIRAYMAHFSDYFKIDWNEFMGLGRFNPANANEKFSMSVLATRLSQEVNGVSKIHGRVSREMFAPLYPGYFAEELHIGHVTNGVHYFTWADNIWQQLYKSTFGADFEKNQPKQENWENIYNVPDEMIWKNRLILKSKLIENLKDKLKRDLTRRFENPKVMMNSLSQLNENTLIIGFARRFATYKRANLLFTNLERLEAIVNHSERPVIFLFSGKAHPNDKAGQDLIKRIIEISKMPQFEGRVIFLEDYDMIGGKLLTSCVDIWLNTPTRPLEASGTSGEKAVMNGVVNLSVLDGWWAEGYLPEAGWGIEEDRTFANQEFQNELDTEIIYNILEKEITPLYYTVNKEGVPVEWVSYIKNTIAKIAPHFTMQRMLEDYYAQFYSILFASHNKMVDNNYANAKSLISWKNKIQQSWDKISVESLHVPDANKGPIDFGKNFVAEIALKIPNLTIDDIGVEILMGNKVERGGDIETIALKQELEAVSFENETATYRCNFPLKHSGVYDYAFRIHPKNHGLAHRMDFPLVKWV